MQTSQIDSVVLITEDMDRNYDTIKSRRDLEKTSRSQAASISSVIEQAGFRVLTISSIETLWQYLSEEKNEEIVFLPHWNDQCSRSRTCHATAALEATGAIFIGNDSHSRILLNDKLVANVLFSDIGFEVPAFSSKADSNTFSNINLSDHKWIVKPRFEGSSIGISSDSIFDRSSLQPAHIKRISADFPEGILLQEFVSGREVSVSVTIDPTGIVSDIAAGVLNHKSDKEYFDSNTYGAQEKFVDHALFEIEYWEVPSEIEELIQRAVHFFGLHDMCRFDFKVKGSTWHFIEATPDPLMAQFSSFYQNFHKAGRQPSDIFRDIADFAIRRHTVKKRY